MEIARDVPEAHCGLPDGLNASPLSENEKLENRYTAIRARELNDTRGIPRLLCKHV